MMRGAGQTVSRTDIDRRNEAIPGVASEHTLLIANILLAQGDGQARIVNGRGSTSL